MLVTMDLVHAGDACGASVVDGEAWFRMQRTVTSDVYENKYKGIGLSLAMLSRALNGSYVNFGVFELYNDPALNNALEYSMKMALSIPPDEVRCWLPLRSLYVLYILLVRVYGSPAGACVFYAA
jgi:hypothetical protein